MPDLGQYTYGIEWYNYLGNPLSPGHSVSGFSFQTPDSPDVLASISNVPPINPGDPPFPVGSSFVYMSYPAQQAGDPSFQFVASAPIAVPEPASLAVLALAGLLLLRRSSRSPSAIATAP